MNHTCGIIYVATGKKYIQEAQISAQTVKNITKLPATLFTNDISLVTQKELFERVIIIPDAKCHFVDKTYGMLHTPYDKTLFLDSDAKLVRDITHLFELLSHFDIALAPDKNRTTGEYKTTPYAFFEWNTAVVLFRKNEITSRLFQKWREANLEEYHQKVEHSDQPSFKHLLFYSEARVYPLPNCYNFITNGLLHLNGKSPVFVIHGREDFIDELIKDERVLKPSPKPIMLTLRNRFSNDSMIIGEYQVPDWIFTVFRGLIKIFGKKR
jgi:hypothetical protein